MARGDFTRWMYRGRRPNLLARFLFDWVRNVRAAGGIAVLRHAGRERIRLEEVPPAQRAPVLKDYLNRAPGARPHIPVDKDAPLSEVEKIAASFPVFRVLAA